MPPGSTPYEQSLKLLLAAVRASPDHLALRATDLVAARDATRIVEFVRDRITVMPALYPDEEPRSARTWGSAATLRGGQGTLRERADILADMLTRAGFKAQVLAADRPSGVGLSELYRHRTTQFAPDQARIDLAKSLLRQAGAPAPPTAKPFDAGPDAAEAILGVLPAQLQKARLRDDLLPAKVPVVGFQDGGKTRYAFALGDQGILDGAPAGLGPYGGADPTRMVTITVSALTNPARGSAAPRGKLVDLVTAHWPAEQVVGRQVLLTFPPLQGPKAILDSGLAALPVRVPMLRLQTSASPVAGGASLIAAGSVITVQGDVLGPSTGGASPSPAGSIDGPFGPIQVLSTADRAAALARASVIKGSANASAFPEIELELAVTDGSGAPVDGLDAASFSVKEQGTAVDGFAVYSNTAVQKRPRVLVVYDAAFVEMWPSAAVKASFESGLANSLSAAAAKTPFDVQVVPLGTPPDAQSWVAPQAAALASSLNAAREVADDPWTSVGGAALDQDVSAIILVSDNDTTDTDPAHVPTFQRRLAASKVPVFVVPVAPINAPVTAQIVSLSGGARLDAGDPGTPARLVSLVQPYLSAWTGSAYRIRYQAPANGPAQRTVVVGLAGRAQPQATMTYSVPAQPLPPPSFAGLYARIEFGPVSSFRRLAGIEATSSGLPLGALDEPVAVAETRAAIDGITTIAVEPGSPTTAALLDDMLSSCLTFEPLRPIWGKATNDQLLQAVSGGVHRFPGVLAAMFFPSAGDPSALPGLKVAILQERVISDSVELHGDLAVAANPVITVTTDANAAFRAAVRQSVAANVTEAAAFGDTAYSRLSGRKLTALANGDYAGWNAFLKTVPAEKLTAWNAMSRVYADYHVIAAAAGAGDALWVIDPASGVAKAVLLDGTGGGLAHSACTFNGFDYLAITLATLSIICGAGGAEVFPLYCVGINAAAAVMAAASLFNHHSDTGTLFGLGMSIFNPLGAGGSTAVGIMLLMITYQQAGCY